MEHLAIPVRIPAISVVSGGHGLEGTGLFMKSCGPRRCQQIPDCFRRIIVPRRLPFVNIVARIIPSAEIKKKLCNRLILHYIYYWCGFGKLDLPEDNTTFLCRFPPIFGWGLPGKERTGHDCAPLRDAPPVTFRR